MPEAGNMNIAQMLEKELQKLERKRKELKRRTIEKILAQQEEERKAGDLRVPGLTKNRPHAANARNPKNETYHFTFSCLQCQAINGTHILCDD